MIFFRKGFTIIELLVVISIIGVLSVIVISSLNETRDKAKDAKLISHARELQKSIETFHLFENRLPTAGSQLNGFGNFVAGNCAGLSDTSYNNNWNEFITDLGEYVPQSFLDLEGDFPYCYFYKHGDHTFCEEFPEIEYVIIMAFYNSSFNSLDQYTDPQGNQRHCLYSL